LFGDELSLALGQDEDGGEEFDLGGDGGVVGHGGEDVVVGMVGSGVAFAFDGPEDVLAVAEVVEAGCFSVDGKCSDVGGVLADS
jgi:hypothetical protein